MKEGYKGQGFYYKLDDKPMDAAFLKGDTVQCRAVLSPEEQADERLGEGSSILILLSTGAKYKGRIIRFTRITINGYAVGELEIVRDSGR
jgi:hypothetical protein